jgi:hypothetical protein
MIQLTEAGFRDALKDTIQLGRDMERERIVRALNDDAVMQTNVSTEWLAYIIQIVEGDAELLHLHRFAH